MVDAKTKQPIDGAVVVALWKYRHITPTGGANEFLDATETTTNANGEFEIPARHYVSIEFVRRVEKETEFTIYKPGYDFFPESSAPKTKDTAAMVRWMITYDNMFIHKEDVVELPVAETKEERKKILIEVRARLWLEGKSKTKKIRDLIDSESKFLGN